MRTQTYKIKFRTVKLAKSFVLPVIAVQLALFSITVLAPGVAGIVSADQGPIPAGCPGSTQAGPANPKVCAKIPAGCPGSTNKGKKKPGTKCPYSASAPLLSPKVPPAPNQDPAIKCDQSSCDLIAKYVNPAIDLFSLCFGLIAAISLVMGGMQYSASQGDPQKTAQAKSRITNTVLAIFAYLFLWAFLQFLIPGGAFH